MESEHISQTIGSNFSFRGYANFNFYEWVIDLNGMLTRRGLFYGERLGIVYIRRIYEVSSISFQTFFILALLLIVHTWNSIPLRSNLLQLQCTGFTVPTTSGRPHGSPLVSACQWPSPQPLSSPQLSHNDSL